MKMYALYLDTPEMRARLNEPEMRARIGATITERRLAWCPPEYRADYLHLICVKHVKAADARPMIFEQMRRDRERAAKHKPVELSPFERQMQALERGARIVANDRIVPVELHGLLAERAA